MTDTQAHGFLLLTVDNVRVIAHANTHTGTLSLECVTIPVPMSPGGTTERDVWLVLRCAAWEPPLLPTMPVAYSRRNYTYTLPEATIHLPALAPAEDLETLEVILAQYGALHHTDFDDVQFTDAKGAAPAERLLLVDETDGEVVGSFSSNINIVEHPSVGAPGREKDPVVVELPEDESTGQMLVRAPVPEERDFITRSAHLLSRGIVFAAGALSAGIGAAARATIAHTSPADKPVHFSERTKRNVRRVHKISGTAVYVSNKTAARVLKAVDDLASHLGRSRTPSPAPQPSPAPLPPRYGEKPTPSTLAPLPPPLPPRKPRLLNSLLMSTDLLLTTLETSAQSVLAAGSGAVTNVITHRYGQEAGDAAALGGATVRNVGVVYVDARGVGRRALLRRAGKSLVKARLGNKDVVFGTGDIPPPKAP